MNIIILLIFGLVMGFSANLLHPTRAFSTFLGNTLLGILGALSGGIVALLLFGVGFVKYDIVSFSIALAAAAGLFYMIQMRKAI